MFDARSLCYLDPEAHQVPCKPRAITSRSSFAAVGLQNNLFCSVRSLGEEENLLPVRNGTTSISTCLDERPTTTVAGTNSALDPAAATNPLSRGVWCRTRGCFSDDWKNKQKQSSCGKFALKRVEALRTARRANNQPKPKKQLRRIRYSTSRCDLLICQISRSKEGREMSENRRTTTLPKALRETTINRTKYER